MSRLPVEDLPARLTPLNLAGAEVHHLPDWSGYEDPRRLAIIRKIALMRGRDPRIASLAVDIIKKAGVKPREYKKQAAALLAWVQDPANVYYINEPGERLQDPIFTIKHGFGDCFAEDTLVLRDDMELVPIQSVKVGTRIWGRDRWSEVVNTWEKGLLPVTEVGLNNGSVLRLTEGHKVYVKSCLGPKRGETRANGTTCQKDHGPECAASSAGWAQCVSRYGSEVVRIRVSELREGMEILQPEKIEQPAGDRWIDSEGAWLLGAFIADGWVEDSRLMLAGKDGGWKEETKHRAQAYAEERGWKTRWDSRYLAINSREAAAFVGECGKGALRKRVPARVLAEGNLAALDDGLKLDAAQNSRGEGWTFGTTSRHLAVQYRVLQRALGRSTSMRVVSNHGGYGSNPIFRVGVRNPAGNKDRRLLVRSISRGVDEVPCYDIATDDHYVYLPEADCTVSNCDDQVLVLCSLFESVRLSWRLCLAGKVKGKKKKVRYIEGQPFPSGVKWAHVYCMVGTPPFHPKKWYFCETTVMGVPLGWDIVDGDKAYLPELAFPPSGGPRVMAAPRAPRGYRAPPLPRGPLSPAYAMAYGSTSALSPIAAAVGSSLAAEMDSEGHVGQKGNEELVMFDWRKIVPAVVTGVAVSVVTQLVLDWIRPKLAPKKRGAA